MRHLHSQELALISGGENHNVDVLVIDPVAAIQTGIYIMSVTDQTNFVTGSVVMGMAVGGAAGILTGIGVGGPAGFGVALVGGAAGAFVGGVAMKGVSTGLVGMYNFILA